MARLTLLGLLGLLALLYIGIGVGAYRYMKIKKVNGLSLLDSAVNESPDTSKIPINELIVYVLMIAIAVSGAIRLVKGAGSGFSIMSRWIIGPPALALFNARKRTGRSLMILAATALLSLFLMLAFAVIGLPERAPVVTLGDMDIKMAQTKASELMDNGFDIYVRVSDDTWSEDDYTNILNSPRYEKYSPDSNMVIPAGYKRTEEGILYSKYLIVKNDTVIGSIFFFGDMKKDTLVKDCKVIAIMMDEDCIKNARNCSNKVKLNGLDLLSTLSEQEFKDTFGRHLWSVPNYPTDETSLYYGIQWSPRSDHLFWNEYYSYVRFDTQNKMTKFSVVAEVAREYDDD
ncbi:hypothetical protein [Mogibacterium pumilum]|uniref:Uncharacterized protein n=1 Tax=Mogibacterium pumilum TaxID=86332 RepID=A0A223ASE1_9FIRM|nr:hypothetical protein [Mogibacterium pumilum]ASS37891.1 hypothetical protein AXF17_05185 [Mogibacterium pumilum]